MDSDDDTGEFDVSESGFQGSRYERPPSVWAGAAPLGGDVYWRPGEAGDGSVVVLGSVLVWHWCTEFERWACAVPLKHTLVGLEPVHLEPSLLFGCCGKHGWIRGGSWVEAS